MAFKKVRFSFDLDMPVLLSMLAAAGSDMKIDVFADAKSAKQPKQLKNGHAPKLLEAPKRTGHGTDNRGRDSNGKRMTSYSAILSFMVANKERGIRPVEMHPVMETIGLSPKSVSPQLTKLRKDGFVKKHADDGLYHVTARGLAHAAKQEAASQSEA